MNSVVIKGETRENVGQKFAKGVRRNGEVPCVIYGGSENVHFTAKANDVSKIVFTPDFNFIDVEVGGSNYTTILKDIQFHPLTDSVLHLDFLELSQDRKVIVEIPLKFVGLAEGAKAGGKLLPLLRKLKVKALPSHLLPELEVNVEKLELGKSIKVSELEFEDIEIITSRNIPIVSIEIPRSLKSAQSAAEGEAGEEGGTEAAEATEE